MKVIPVLILSIALSGCGFFTKKQENPIIVDKTINIDKSYLEPCNLLDENLVVKTFEDGVEAYAMLGKEYSYCAKKQNNSILIIKKLGNIK